MFKFLRKILIFLFLVSLGGVGYYFWSNPAYQREIIETAVVMKEKIQDGDKKFAWSGPGLVANVLNGDTLVVDTEQAPKVTMRLASIDAPELAPTKRDQPQPLSQESKDFLAKLVKNQPVHISIVGVDFLKRPVVLLQKDNVVVNVKMVEAGMAEVTEDFNEPLPAKIRFALQDAQTQAKTNHLGIWALANYQRPFEYRLRHRLPGAVSSPRP